VEGRGFIKNMNIYLYNKRSLMLNTYSSECVPRFGETVEIALPGGPISFRVLDVIYKVTNDPIVSGKLCTEAWVTVEGISQLGRKYNTRDMGVASGLYPADTK
jgi:hypothetical protein